MLVVAIHDRLGDQGTELRWLGWGGTCAGGSLTGAGGANLEHVIARS
jgi:hypothetical protein